MDFEKDVFISYAHLDDKPLDDGTLGWISDFHKLLQTRLEQTMGKSLNIWRDERLTGNEIFGPEIESQLPKMKVMVSIITPRYIDSDWCRKEIDGFYKAAKNNGGVSIGNKSRIFKVVKTPVDKEVIEQLPESIHKIFDEILDYKFYNQEPATERFRELRRGSYVDPKIQQDFMDKLDDVVQDIAKLIKQLNNSEKGSAPKKKVYLSETSYDLISFRDNLVRELEEAGYTVLPNKQLPNVIDKFTYEVEKFINDSELCIHLISATNYAAQPEGSDKSSVILQNEIAAKISGSSGLNRLIWIPPAVPNANTSEKLLALQNDFITRLRSDHDYQQGADLLEGSIEDFKFSIFDTLRRIEAEEKAKLDKQKEEEEKAKKAAEAAAAAITTPTATYQSDEPKIVYLICDKRDMTAASEFETFLNDNNIEMLTPAFDGEAEALTNAHKENLKICDGIIIFYGEGNDLWAKTKKSDLLGINALGRTKPLLAKAVYLAKPELPEKESFKILGGLQLKGYGDFNADLLNDFLQKLK